MKKIVPSDSVIVIGILARDCVRSLRSNIEKVEKLGKMFGDYHVVILENDSKDGTDEEIKDWSEKNPKVTYINERIELPQSITTLECPYPEKGVHRIEKMARLRNRVLDELEKRFQPDVFCFIDIDIQDFFPSSIVQAIENAPKDWGGLFGNGIVFWDSSEGKKYVSPFQYDSFAYVAQGDDYTLRGDYVVTPEFHPQVAYQMTLGLRTYEYLPCESAFNGIGVYRYDAIAGARYSILQNDALKAINSSLCEHIGFNKKVREKGYGIYIAREMKVIYHHKLIRNIIGDIAFDFSYVFSLSNNQIPFGLSELRPGVLALIESWYYQKNVIETKLNTNAEETLRIVQRKNYKHLRWLRILIVVSVVELLTLIILIFLNFIARI